jgi:hypothetical protein
MWEGALQLILRVITFIYGIGGLAFNVADAAKIDVIAGQDTSVVTVVGEIGAGDGDRFGSAVGGIERALVILKSPGGLVRDALQIGAEIRLRGFATSVPDNVECLSACGLVWLSGARRYMSPESRIGFHAAYKNENGEYRESGVANAEIGSFLTHLGLRIEAIRFFTIAGPNEFLLLTPERARALGIEIYEQRDGAITTPVQQPTIDTYTSRFVALAFLNARCLSIFDPNTSVLKDEMEAAFDKGHQIVSSDEWIKLMTRQLDVTKQEGIEIGTLMQCLRLERELRAQGVATGISGPSFDCSIAPWSAICKDQNLWAKDRAMNTIYFFIRKNMSPARRKQLLAVQRQWLKSRDNCGTDLICLNDSYDQRLDNFRKLELPS